MRHGNKVNNLGRKKGHRAALLKNLANALLQHKRINTTLAKAKALRVFVEPIITRSKTNTTHSRRIAFKYLQDKETVDMLFEMIAPKVADRPGGYTRIIKTGNRQGDAAEMAMIELVDFNDTYGNSSDAGKAKRTRRGRKSAPAAVAAPAPVKAAETAQEE